MSAIENAVRPACPSLVDWAAAFPADQEPTRFFVVFHERSTHRLVDWLAFGKFKHVSLFGYVEGTGNWLFYDYSFERTWIRVIPEAEAEQYQSESGELDCGEIGYYSTLGTVVVLDRQPTPPANFLTFLKPGAGCVPFAAHILGIRTWAVRPDALFRKCIAAGGQIVNCHGVGK